MTLQILLVIRLAVGLLAELPILVAPAAEVAQLEAEVCLAVSLLLVTSCR